MTTMLAATMEAFGMDTVNDTPKHTLLPESIHSMPVEEQETMLYLAMKDVVAKHICMEFNPTHQPQMCQDGVVEYARELLSMGCCF